MQWESQRGKNKNVPDGLKKEPVAWNCASGGTVRREELENKLTHLSPPKVSRQVLLAVRRLVEKGNKVALAGDDEASCVMNKATKLKIPVKKKGGAFVIEAHFVKRGSAGQA